MRNCRISSQPSHCLQHTESAGPGTHGWWSQPAVTEPGTSRGLLTEFSVAFACTDPSPTRSYSGHSLGENTGLIPLCPTKRGPKELVTWSQEHRPCSQHRPQVHEQLGGAQLLPGISCPPFPCWWGWTSQSPAPHHHHQYLRDPLVLPAAQPHH